jgi:hypothetical protein
MHPATVALLAGGHGTFVDFPGSAELQAALAEMFSHGKVVAGKRCEAHKSFIMITRCHLLAQMDEQFV